LTSFLRSTFINFLINIIFFILIMLRRREIVKSKFILEAKDKADDA